MINLGGDEKGTPKNGIRYLKKNMSAKFEFDIYIDNANIEIYFDNYEESFSFFHFSSENKLIMENNESVQVNMIRENIEVK